MKWHHLLTAGLVVGLGVGNAFAQQTSPRTDPQQPRTSPQTGQQSSQYQHMGGSNEIVKGSTLIGVDVKDMNDENLGTIEDLVIAADGQIALALIEMEEGGEGMVGVPADKLQAKPRGGQQTGGQSGQEQDEFGRQPPRSGEERMGGSSAQQSGGQAKIQQIESVKLNVPKDQLQNAPRWVEGRTSLDTYVSSVMSHFGGGQSGQSGRSGQSGQSGQTGQSGQSGQMGGQSGMGQSGQMSQAGQPRGPYALASRVMGSEVSNNQQEDLGEIQDIAFTLATEKKAVYAVLDHGGILGMGEKQFAVPWEALQTRGSGEQVMLNVQASQLAQAEGFDEWPAQPDQTLFRPAQGSGGQGGFERR